jgi:TRAP transporter TAXI family solute receptor
MSGLPRWAAPTGSLAVSRRAVLLGSAGLLVTGCGRTSTPALTELRIATGPPGAVYREVGATLAGVLAGRFPNTTVRTIPTGASVDNLRLLHQRGTDLAFVSVDSAVAGLKAGVPRSTTAIARLYDSFIQLVARADGPIRELADLHERTVSVGAAGSGTEFITRRMLSLTPAVKPRLIVSDQAASATALIDRRIDAFFTLTGVPTPAITDLLRQVPLWMVPLGDLVERMNSTFGEEYAPATIASSAYDGIPATETMTVANLLVVQPDLDADVVQLITRTLFAERARIARGHQEANRINVRTGIATSPVPLHPGAARYYRSAKR